MKSPTLYLLTLLGLAVLPAACGRQASTNAAVTSVSEISPITISIGDTNCLVSVVVFDQTECFERLHSETIARNAKRAQQIKDEFGVKKAAKFLDELEEFCPSPFAVKDWTMVTPARILAPCTNEVWLVLARFAPKQKDCALRIETTYPLAGSSFTNAVSTILLQLRDSWPHRMMKFSESKLFDEDGVVVSKEVREWCSSSEFPTQK